MNNELLADAVCRECGYRLFGLSEQRCPECGSAFDSEDPASYRLDHVPELSRQLVWIAGLANFVAVVSLSLTVTGNSFGACWVVIVVLASPVYWFLLPVHPAGMLPGWVLLAYNSLLWGFIVAYIVLCVQRYLHLRRNLR